MIELIEDNRHHIATICRKHHVRKLDVFGSAATGEFDAQSSDIDLLVEFNDMEPGTYADHYFGMSEDLESLLERSIDLVVVRAVRNPHFLESLNRTRQQLYAA